VPRLGSFEKWISRYYPVGPLSSLLLPVIAARCARTRCPFPFVGCRLPLDGFKVELFSSLSFPSKFPRHYFPGNSLVRPIRQERPRGSSPRSIDRLSQIRFADMPVLAFIMCLFRPLPVPRNKHCDRRVQITDDEVVNARRTDNAPRMRPCIITRSKNGLLPAKRRAPASGTCGNDRRESLVATANRLAIDRALANFHPSLVSREGEGEDREDHVSVSSFSPSY